VVWIESDFNRVVVSSKTDEPVYCYGSVVQQALRPSENMNFL